MRKLLYSMMVSLDGFIETPTRALDWVLIDEELHKYVNDRQGAIDTYLYGRRMYELMADFWPTADADRSAQDYIVEFARIWKATPKIVFSKTLEHVEWNSRLVRDNVVEEIENLKRQPGEQMAVGGSDLANTLMRNGLIDEYELYVNPVILGDGRPMFKVSANQRNDRQYLELVETRTFRSGVVLLHYDRGHERT
jgi:dihydrofolate reductase